MRRIITVSLLSLACVTGEAMAICTNNSMVNPVNTLNTLLSNKTVCGTDGTDKWQEEHRSNGALWEYAKGPNDPVDPSHQVGMWTLEENGQPGNGRPSVRYIYNGGSAADDYLQASRGPLR